MAKFAEKKCLFASRVTSDVKTNRSSSNDMKRK